jgi:hypothetical protein
MDDITGFHRPKSVEPGNSDEHLTPVTDPDKTVAHVQDDNTR